LNTIELKVTKPTKKDKKNIPMKPVDF